jgi:biopolymer transport protein TolQ
MMGLGLQGIGGVAVGVILMLLAMSIVSMAIVAERWWLFRQALEFASLVRVADLRRGLSVLATIGATAPFVGLFGTTFGIINAFRAIAITGSTNMAVISSGVSEALITTAFGLVVAVPAVWAYNAFLGRVQSFQVELDRGRYVLLSYLDRVSE